MKRRAILAGIAALAAAGGAAWRLGLFGKHYPPTPYDDLLAQITDREPAILFGRKARIAAPPLPQLAAMLRRDGRDLATRAAIEPAQARVVEVDGWLVPEAVALYAALAAQV